MKNLEKRVCEILFENTSFLLMNLTFIEALENVKYEVLRNIDFLLPNDWSTSPLLSIYKILFLRGLTKLSSFDILLSGQSRAER